MSRHTDYLQNILWALKNIIFLVGDYSVYTLKNVYFTVGGYSTIRTNL